MSNITSLEKYEENTLRPNDLLEGKFYSLSNAEIKYIKSTKQYQTVHTVINKGGKMSLVKQYLDDKDASVLGYLVWQG